MTEAADPMAALKGRFLQRCQADLDRLKLLLADPEMANGEEVRMLVHRFSGAAGTFGYPAISDLAGAIDDDFHDGKPVSLQDLDALAEAIAAILPR